MNGQAGHLKLDRGGWHSNSQYSPEDFLKLANLWEYVQQLAKTSMLLSDSLTFII